MNFTFNEKTFQALQIQTPPEQKVFLYQLGVVLTQIIGAIQGGKISPVNGNQLTLSTTAFGSVGTNQTISVANANSVSISITLTANLTLTLNNLQVGIPVVIKASSTGSFTLKLAATTPTGTAYAISGITTAGATVNLVSSGLALSSTVSAVMPGNSVVEGSTPTLYLGIVG